MKTGNEAAVAAYRKLAVGSNPIFSEELITGSTIAEVDASMKKVTGLAEGIKTRLEDWRLRKPSSRPAHRKGPARILPDFPPGRKSRQAYRTILNS